MLVPVKVYRFILLCRSIMARESFIQKWLELFQVDSR